MDDISTIAHTKWDCKYHVVCRKDLAAGTRTIVRMTRLVLPFGLALLCCGACRGSTEREVPRSRPAAADRPVQRDAAPSRARSSDAGPAPDRTPAVAPDRPSALLELPSGAALLWARETSEGQSELRFLSLRPDGIGSAPARTLRTVGVKVASIEVARTSGGVSAVAFCGSTGRGTAAYGLVWIGDDGRVSGPTVQLGVERLAGELEHGSTCDLSVFAAANEVLVFQRNGLATCTGITDYGRAGSCAAYVLKRLAPGQPVQQFDSAEILPDVGRLTPIVALPWGYAWHVDSAGDFGAEVLEIRYDDPDQTDGPIAREGPRGPTATGHTTIQMPNVAVDFLAWNGSTLLFAGTEEGNTILVAWRNGHRLTAGEGPSNTGERGRRGTRRVSCEEGRPGVVFRDEDGLEVGLFAGRPGASIPWRRVLPTSFIETRLEAAAWTGQGLLTVSPDGRFTIVRCERTAPVRRSVPDPREGR